MSLSEAPNINYLWSYLLIEELWRSGVDFFCISPGSRSTPLALAVAEQEALERVRCVVHYDERGAAFCALGYAKTTGWPAAVICTSGSAAANYWPAVVEAAQAEIPLVLLTSDRPPELLQVGANQAIQQVGLYSGYVRWQCSLPAPTADAPPEMVLTAADEAVFQAMRRPRGPVHVNCPFREPLAPSAAPMSPVPRLLEDWERRAEPYMQRFAAAPAPEGAGKQRVLELIAKAERGLLILGEMTSHAEAAAAAEIARKLGWPAFPDVLSRLRGKASLAPWVPHFDVLLASRAFQERLRPDLILHLGCRLVSKRLQALIEDSGAAYLQVRPSPQRIDPGHRVHCCMESEIQAFAAWLGRESEVFGADMERTRALSKASAGAEAILQAYEEGVDTLTEPTAARVLSGAAPGVLFAGNSMPVRDLLQFSAPRESLLPVLANRGASGIDGNVAAVAGVAQAAEKPVTAVLGDLAVLHDLNSLPLLREAPVPVVLVVLNNRGGGIFSFLPVRDHSRHFERYFGTPHSYTFEAAANMFGLIYRRARSCAQFRAVLAEAHELPAVTLIEVQSVREENLALHQRLRGHMIAAAEAALGEHA